MGIQVGNVIPIQLTLELLLFSIQQPTQLAMMAGALVGSDLFNVLGVLGLAAFITPLRVTGSVGPIWMMAGMMTVLLIFMRSGWRLTRMEGAALIALALLRWSLDITGTVASP